MRSISAVRVGPIVVINKRRLGKPVSSCISVEDFWKAVQSHVGVKKEKYRPMKEIEVEGFFDDWID